MILSRGLPALSVTNLPLVESLANSEVQSFWLHNKPIANPRKVSKYFWLCKEERDESIGRGIRGQGGTCKNMMIGGNRKSVVSMPAVLLALFEDGTFWNSLSFLPDPRIYLPPVISLSPFLLLHLRRSPSLFLLLACFCTRLSLPLSCYRILVLVKQVSNAVEWGDSLARVYLLQGKLQERAAYKRKSNCICILLTLHKYLLTYGLVFFFLFCFSQQQDRANRDNASLDPVFRSGFCTRR